MLLADSETVRSSDRRLSRFDRRRSCRDRCRCRRCRSCSGWRCCRRSERTGWRRQCAAGTGSAASAGGAGSSTTTRLRVLDRSERVPPLEEVRCLRLRPHRQVQCERRRRAQTARPAVKRFGRRWWRGRSANRHIASAWKFGRSENVSSGSRVAPAPASCFVGLSSIGGEPLAGSGFETQAAQRGFAPASVKATDGAAAPGPAPSSPSTARGGTSGDSVASADSVEAAPGGVSDQRGSAAASDVASVGSAGPASPQPPPAARGKSALSRAADQVRGFGAGLDHYPRMPRRTPRHQEFQSITRSNS